MSKRALRSNEDFENLSARKWELLSGPLESVSPGIGARYIQLAASSSLTTSDYVFTLDTTFHQLIHSYKGHTARKRKGARRQVYDTEVYIHAPEVKIFGGHVKTFHSKVGLKVGAYRWNNKDFSRPDATSGRIKKDMIKQGEDNLFSVTGVDEKVNSYQLSFFTEPTRQIFYIHDLFGYVITEGMRSTPLTELDLSGD